MLTVWTSLLPSFVGSPTPQADPPVKKELLVRVNDGDTATCLDLAHVDHYTFVPSTKGWFPPPQDKCLLPGLLFKARVVSYGSLLYTVRIVGHGLVCSASHIIVSMRQKIVPGCAISGEYRRCKLTGPVVSNPVGLTTCVATCVCEGDDCAHVSIHLPVKYDAWKICEIHTD